MHLDWKLKIRLFAYFFCVVCQPGLSVCSFLPDYPGVAFSKSIYEKTFTCKGGSVSGSGLSLTIPKEAIPRDESVTISVRPCIGGPFNFPKNYSLISPVYLVEPPFAFHKHLTLHIELFAETEDKEDIYFMTSPPKPTFKDTKAEWNFALGYSKPVLHKTEENIGVMRLKHFCFFAFAGKYLYF